LEKGLLDDAECSKAGSSDDHVKRGRNDTRYNVGTGYVLLNKTGDRVLCTLVFRACI
jgi:hypothetical protein